MTMECSGSRSIHFSSPYPQLAEKQSTSTLRDRVNYSGPTGGLITEGEQCAFAVQNCTK